MEVIVSQKITYLNKEVDFGFERFYVVMFCDQFFFVIGLPFLEVKQPNFQCLHIEIINKCVVVLSLPFFH